MVHGRTVSQAAWMAAVAVLAGADARAAAPSASTDAIEVAARTASAQWPGSKCRGREVVAWVPQVVLDATHAVRGLAGDALRATCTVRVVASARTWPGPRLCALLQHEFGHLAGRRHTRDPRDVMYEGTIPWTMPCTRAFPPSRARSRAWECRTARVATMAIVWKCRPRPRGAPSRR